MKMQATLKEKEEEEKIYNYMPIANPHLNKVYNLIKEHEKEIMGLVIIFINPDRKHKEYMSEKRSAVKDIACKNCSELNRTIQSKQDEQVLVKDEILSKSHDKPVFTQQWRQSEKKSMACKGCRGLKLKQIATGYIKGRTLKQV
jgi:hypothetical protein